MRVFRNRFRGVAGVIDDDLLRRDDDVHSVAERLDVKFAVGREELHQVERRQVARRVVQEHVLAARVRSVDAARGLAGMPLVDGGVELHARVAALPGRLGDLAHQVARPVGGRRSIGPYFFGRPVAVGEHGLHELIRDAHAVVGVLEEDRAVGVPVER